MLFELDNEILLEMEKLKSENAEPSKIIRIIFTKYGEISPPIMADYFEVVFKAPAMKFMPALGTWWHDNSTEITDDEFDRRITNAILKFGFN